MKIILNNCFGKKSIMTCVLLFVLFAKIDAQFINVPIVGQQNSLWCWAASIEMVGQSHGVGLSQCELAKSYFEFNKWRFTSMSNPICLPANWCNTRCGSNCTQTPCSGTRPYGNCNRTIDFTKKGGKIKPHYFDLIFNEVGFNSIEDVRVDNMDWVNIVKEIESCRPFILMLDKFNVRFQTTEYNHAVVVKGHYDAGWNKFVLINDPQTDPNLCSGHEELIPFSALSINPPIGSSSYTYNNALEVIRFIHPKDKEPCEIECKILPPEENSLIRNLKLNSNDKLLAYLRENKSTISDRKLTEFLSLQNDNNNLYVEIPFAYKDFNNNAKNIMLIVLNQTKPKLAIQLDRHRNNWRLGGIIEASNTLYIEKLEELSLEEKDINLTIPYKNYEIVNYLPDYYSFYKVNYESKNYLIPAHNYQELNLEEKILYPEEKVVNILKEVTQNRMTEEVKQGEQLPTTIEKETKKKNGFWPLRWMFKQN